MHLLSLLSSSLLILGAACAPIEHEASMSMSGLGNLLKNIRPNHGGGSCGTSKVSLPETGNGAELPSPASELALKYITLGVGTQNYTCANLEKSAKPALVGAVATLYDVSCLASQSSWFLDMFARMVVRLPVRMVNRLVPKYLGSEMQGHHYFEGRVPLFDLRTNGHNDYAYVSVAAKVPAPQNRDVDWLRLDRVDGSGIEAVYRVKTTAGKAPTSCKNMPDQFEVKYIAQYWMYG
ncbi:predicted protein [Uncinocarpus reesii 1704]|uniref:Malate dehydrogenase n=1 Tax=Uncinocarpus reesii (strain UAMH 1704) TaxID=336963 RepID=C4JJP5_UNCRE|nr:uncharacterized protein UREG_01852 [Uncinocarpus reesii 1704]EEP77003.1 predicted protein [Uncinocarpus reesii 1704]